jgi:hypothetical protein
VDQLLDEGQHAITDIKSMTLEQWQNLQQRWDTERTGVERQGPRQFQRGAATAEVDLSREAREVIVREARRGGVTARDVFANREDPTKELRRPTVDTAPERHASEPMEGGVSQAAQPDAQDSIERTQNVGGGEFPPEIPRPAGVGVEEAPVPTPQGDDAGPEGPEEPVTRSTDGEETSQDARAALPVDIVLEDEVETESEGLISPIRTPALPQDGDTEPGQHRNQPVGGGGMMLDPDAVIGRTTDSSRIAEREEPPTEDPRVVETPPRTLNPRKRPYEEGRGPEIRQALEGHARKALRMGEEVTEAGRRVERTSPTGEPAGDKMVDERERTETQYSLRKRRILRPKAVIGKYTRRQLGKG